MIGLMRIRHLFLFILMLIVNLGLIGDETWVFSADRVSSVQTDDFSRTILDGSAQVQTENLLFKADKLELSGEDYNRITGERGISLFDSDRNLSIEADSLSYNRKEKLIEFRGKITMVDYDEDTVIRCEILNLREDDELVEMQVFVRLIQDDTVARGEFATFEMDDEILDITGNPVVWRDDDEYRAESIRVNLATEEITMTGKVAGSLITKGDDSEAENAEETEKGRTVETPGGAAADNTVNENEDEVGE